MGYTNPGTNTPMVVEDRASNPAGRRRVGAPNQTRYQLLGAAAALLALTSGAAAQAPFIPNDIVTSTVPANGDVNPYGVALVPLGFAKGGMIAPRDILVSNFNNSKNLQGTGTTIVTITPNGVVSPPGQATVFFQGKNLGLDTALGTLKLGFVVVGNLPSADGSYAKHRAGGLLVLDNNGKLVANLTSSRTTRMNGPWDMTIFDQGSTAKVFVSNVGNVNNGFVTRLDLSITPTNVSIISAAVIATGYTVQPNSAAFVFGPTGLVYDPSADILYVASTADNAIFAVKQAGTRTGSVGQGVTIFADDNVLRGPLGMVQAPNGDLIAANGDGVNGDLAHPSEYVEFTKTGTFVAQFNVDVNQGGAFGLGVGTGPRDAPRLAVVDDNVPDLIIFTGPAPTVNGPAK
jgi:hypothetical protein